MLLLGGILQIIQILLNVIWWVILIQAVLSWLIAFNVVNTHNDFIRQVYMTINQLTEPMYRPIRRIMPDFGALDFSPMVVLLIIYILMNVVIPRLALSLGAA